MSITVRLRPSDFESEDALAEAAIDEAVFRGLPIGTPAIRIRDAYRADSGTHIADCVEVTVYIVD